MRRSALAAAFIALLGILIAVTMVGCSRDPDKGKRKYLESGLRYMKKGRYRDASLQFRNALKLDAAYIDALDHLAEALAALRDWNGAYTTLRRTIELDPNRLGARLNLGRLYLEAREFAKAEEEARFVVARDPANAAAYDILSVSLMLQQEKAKAREALLKLTELSPRNPSGYVNLALVNMSMSRGDEAEQDFRKAIELDPHSVQAFTGLAGYFRLQNRVPDALATLQKGVDANPDSAELQIARADVLYADRRKDEAAATLRQFLDKHPKSADGAMAIGDFYTQRGDREAAAAAYRLGMTADPKNVSLKERMVEWYTDAGKLPEAEALIAEIVRVRPKDPITGIARGRIRLAQHKPEEAVDILRQQARDFPDIWQAHYFLALAYRQTQQRAQAKNELQEALRIAPNLVLVRRALTELSLESGDLQTARETAERTVQLFPASPHDRVLLGTAMLGQKQVAAARNEFGVARQLAPGDVDSLMGLGMAAEVEHKWAEAEQQFEAALKLNPRLGQALGALADVWIASGQLQKGIARAARQVEAYPEDAGAHFILATLYVASGRAADAKEQFGRSIQLNPQLIQAYTRLADLHQTLGENDAALARYEQALAIEPKSVLLHSITADLYSRKGHAAEARKHYQQALTADPSFGPAANNLAWLELQNGGNLDVALSWAQKAKELLPDSPATTDTLAWVEYKKGLASSAIPLLKECVQRAPQSAVYQFHLGMALAASGIAAEAKAHLATALRLKLDEPDSANARQALSSLN